MVSNEKNRKKSNKIAMKQIVFGWKKAHWSMDCTCMLEWKEMKINDQTTWPLWHTRNYAVAKETRWNRFHSFELKNRGNQIIRHFLDWRTQKFKQNQNFDNFFKNFDTISTMSSNHFCFKYLHNAFAIGSRNWNAHCKNCHCACFSGEQINFS